MRNIPDEIYRGLRVQAAMHGQSAEAEMRSILESAIKRRNRVKLGSLLLEIGEQARLTDDEFSIISQVRDKTPAEPVSFE
ncbi:MAG: FitA-like ribbon-helix-helix domain-containing protein [Leucothrix sp.]